MQEMVKKTRIPNIFIDSILGPKFWFFPKSWGNSTNNARSKFLDWLRDLAWDFFNLLTSGLRNKQSGNRFREINRQFSEMSAAISKKRPTFALSADFPCLIPPLSGQSSSHMIGVCDVHKTVLLKKPLFHSKPPNDLAFSVYFWL